HESSPVTPGGGRGGACVGVAWTVRHESVPLGGVGGGAAVEAAAGEADAAVAGDGAVGGGCVAGGDRASWIEAGPLPRPPCAAQPHHRIPLLLPRRSRRVLDEIRSYLSGTGGGSL
ncbi:unnamed protein product, partial [Urochloa humidicola]